MTIKHLISLLGLGLVLIPGIAAHSEPSNYDPETFITELSPDTFDDFIQNEELVLIKFYTLWCKHCQAFAPVFIQASKQLHAEKPLVKLAQVDCMVHDALCRRFNIDTYPSLKITRKGGEVYDYIGGRNAYGIVKHMVAESFPITQSVGDTGALLQARAKSSIVLYDSDPASALAQAFATTAAHLRGAGSFVSVADPAVIAASGAEDGSVVAYNAFGLENHTLRYERAGDPSDELLHLKRWCTRVYTPLVQVYNHNVEASYGVIGKPLLVVFGKEMDPVTNPSGVKYIVNRVKKLALELVDKVSCVIMDVTQDDYNRCDFTWVRKYGVAIFDYENSLKYCLDDALTEKMIRPKDISDFAHGYVEGKIQPFFRAQQAPEAEEGAVRTVVRAQVVDEFLRDKNDRAYLLEVFTPWCSLCEDLRPTYEKLAEEYLPMGHRFEFARIDATKNDLPKEYATNGYPTLFWVEAGKGSTPVAYEDLSFEREKIVEFIEKNLDQDKNKRSDSDTENRKDEL